MSSLLVILLLNAEINAENRAEHFHTEGGSLFIYDIIIQHIITSEVSTSKHISAESTQKKKILFFLFFCCLSINCLFPALICTRGATFSVSYSSANNKKGDKCAPQGRICAFPHGEEERLSLHLRRHHPPIRAGPCWRTQTKTWETVCGTLCVCECMCVRACAHVCVRARAAHSFSVLNYQHPWGKGGNARWGRQELVLSLGTAADKNRQTAT